MICKSVIIWFLFLLCRIDFDKLSTVCVVLRYIVHMLARHLLIFLILKFIENKPVL